jgi:hypothetical protein
MKNRKKVRAGYAACVRNEGYPASLELNKIYLVLPDSRAAADGYIRVVDESGEDYLYPSEFFLVLTLPDAQAQVLDRSLAQAAG